MINIKKIVMAVAVSVMSLSLVACGSSNSDKKDNTGNGTVSENSATPDNGTESESSATPDASKEEETVTIKDARGEVTIPANPKRIVDISGNSDMLSILGYSVVGTANSDAYDYTKFPTYLEDVLKDATILGYSMQNEMDIEAILALDPDMIIISSVQEGMYKQLQEVAPTVMIELAQIDWTDDLLEVAAIFNKTAEAEAWLAEYKKTAADTGAALKKTYGEDASYLAFLASAGNIYIFDAAGTGSILFEDMGLKKPEGMPEQTDISLPVVTYEGLAAIDADYIFAIGTDEDLAALTESSIWKAMPAVKEGRVVTLPASPYFNMGYSSIGRLGFVNEITKLMESMNE